MKKTHDSLKQNKTKDNDNWDKLQCPAWCIPWGARWHGTELRVGNNEYVIMFKKWKSSGSWVFRICFKRKDEDIGLTL